MSGAVPRAMIERYATMSPVIGLSMYSARHCSGTTETGYVTGVRYNHTWSPSVTIGARSRNRTWSAEVMSESATVSTTWMAKRTGNSRSQAVGLTWYQSIMAT